MQTIVKNIKRVFTIKDKTITADSEEILGYKVYIALLNQTGTNQPTAKVLKNTLGETPTFTYTGVGNYNLNTIGTLFIANKTFLIHKSIDVPNSCLLSTSYNNTTSISFSSYEYPTDPLTNADNVLIDFPIEIRVYP